MTEGTKEWHGDVSRLETAIATLAKQVEQAPKADPEARKAIQQSLTGLQTELAELKKSISAGEATAAEVTSLKSSISTLQAEIAELKKSQTTQNEPPKSAPNPEPGKKENTPGEPPKTERRASRWI